jgi:hypothetical protein
MRRSQMDGLKMTDEMSMVGSIRAFDPCGDLFADAPRNRRHDSLPRRAQPRELEVARALSRQLRRKRARREKQRIAHLICLNLISMLEHKR